MKMAMPDENCVKPAGRSPKRDSWFRGLFRRVPWVPQSLIVSIPFLSRMGELEIKWSDGILHTMGNRTKV